MFFGLMHGLVTELKTLWLRVSHLCFTKLNPSGEVPIFRLLGRNLKRGYSANLWLRRGSQASIDAHFSALRIRYIECQFSSLQYLLCSWYFEVPLVLIPNYEDHVLAGQLDLTFKVWGNSIPQFTYRIITVSPVCLPLFTFFYHTTSIMLGYRLEVLWPPPKIQSFARTVHFIFFLFVIIIIQYLYKLWTQEYLIIIINLHKIMSLKTLMKGRTASLYLQNFLYVSSYNFCMSSLFPWV